MVVLWGGLFTAHKQGAGFGHPLPLPCDQSYLPGANVKVLMDGEGEHLGSSETCFKGLIEGNVGVTVFRILPKCSHIVGYRVPCEGTRVLMYRLSGRSQVFVRDTRLGTLSEML